MPLVSIIIPLYNRKALIKETLDCLREDLHTAVSLEVIVVDDGSTDGADIFVEEHYPQVKLLRQMNAGAPAARNRGLKEAKGEFILFLDSDDLIEADFFNKKIIHLTEHRELAAVYGPWFHFEINGKGEKNILPRHTDYPLINEPNYTTHLENLLGGWYIICHAILWRRENLAQLGGYNETLKVNQDVDLLFRALANRMLIKGVNSPRAEYRSHQEDNRTGNINVEKVTSIYNLRIYFLQELEKNSLLTSENKKTLAHFCFNLWADYRESLPEIAEQSYRLSKKLYPDLTLQGGAVYRLLCKITGPKNTVLLKSLFQKITFR